MSNIRGDCEDAYLGVHPLRSVQGKFRGQQANVTPHVKFILQPILLKKQARIFFAKWVPPPPAENCFAYKVAELRDTTAPPNPFTERSQPPEPLRNFTQKG